MPQEQQSHQGLHSLATIIKRLEAATSRLEDVATSQLASQTSLRSPTASAHDHLAGALAPGAAAAGANNSAAAPPPPPPPPPPPAEEEVSPSLKAYQELIDGPFAEFISNAKKVGGVVEQHSVLFEPLMKAQYDYVKMASQVQKPAQSSLGGLLKPQSEAIGAIVEAKDSLGRGKEGREYGAALSVLGDGAGAWGWVTVEPPAPFVGEMKDASQFWVDRCVKQFKDTNADVATWARSVSSLLSALQKYVKQWHTTGVAWNPKGPAAPSSVPSSSSSGPAPSSSAPTNKSPAKASGGGQAALLADLNKGGAITSGLRKVDPSQMTHKNPELRAGGSVPDKDAGSTSPSRSPPPIKAKPAGFSKQPAKKPAKLELEDGNKWIIEYQEDNKNIVIDQTSINQTVHIFSCKNSVIQVMGKVNAITILNCKKTSLVVDSAVSSLSITASPSFEVQITGSVPTVQIDNTDSGLLYLSKECAPNVEIITSKTSAINISIPSGDDGDFTENPVPEQMRHKVVGGKLVTEIVEHLG